MTDSDEVNVGRCGVNDSTVGAPRWVKLMLIITVAIVAFAILLMVLVGGHGPGRHGLSGSTTDGSATAVLKEAHER